MIGLGTLINTAAIIGGGVAGMLTGSFFKTTPHNPRLTPLHVICLHFFRHSTQIFLAGRQPACVKFMHSDEKTDFTSDAQGLCGIALKKNSSSHCQKPAESACFLSRVHILFHTRISF